MSKFTDNERYPVVAPADADTLFGKQTAGTKAGNRFTFAAAWSFFRAKLTATPVTIAEGGTGAATPTAARDALRVQFTRASAANDGTGSTTITLPAASRHHAVDLVFTGAPGTRIIVADTAGAITGDVLVLDYTLPATPDIVVELRNATAGGTLLDTLTTDATADSACIRLTYSGTVWQLNSALYPAN